MNTDFEQGQKVKFQRTESKDQSNSFGHAAPKGGARVVHNGEEVFLEFGEVFQVSENTSAEVANMNNKPLPLIKASWLNSSSLKSNFKLIESDNED